MPRRKRKQTKNQPSPSTSTPLNWKKVLFSGIFPEKINLYERDNQEKTLWETLATEPPSPNFDERFEKIFKTHQSQNHEDEVNAQNNGLSPLGMAIMENNIDGIFRLLEYGCLLHKASVNQPLIPFILRHISDETFIIDTLIDDLDTFYLTDHIKDTNGIHALQIALEDRHSVNLGLALIEIGIDPNDAIDEKYHILDSLKKPELRPSIGHFIKLLRPEKLYRFNEQHMNPLMSACYDLDLNLVEIILSQYAFTHALNQKKQNALHILASIPHRGSLKKDPSTMLAICNLLIQSGINTNSQDHNGNTPCMLAIRNGHTHFAELLLNPANPHLLNQFNESILSIALNRDLTAICKSIILAEQSIASPPFSLLTHPTGLPLLFKNTSLHLIKQKSNINLAMFQPLVDQPISALSLCILMTTLRPHTIELLEYFLSSSPLNPSFVSDLYPMAAAIESYEIIGKLLRYGFPHQPQEKILLNDPFCQKYGIKDHLSIIKSVNQSLSSHIDNALALIQRLPPSFIPLQWIANHWMYFGQYFLMLCLETSEIDATHQILFQLISRYDLTPLSALYHHADKSCQQILMSSLDKVLDPLYQSKHQSQSSPASQTPVIASSTSHISAVSPHSNPEQHHSTPSPEPTASDPNITHPHTSPNHDYSYLQNPESTDYQQRLHLWRHQLFQQLTTSHSPEKKLDDHLPRLFLKAFNTQVINHLCEDQFKNTDLIVKILQLLHLCTCPKTRTLLMKKIKPLFLSLQKNSSQKPTVDYFLCQHQSFAQKVTTHKLDEDSIICIAKMIFNLIITSGQPSAYAFYHSFSMALLANNHFLSHAKYLSTWIESYSHTITWLSEPAMQKHLLVYLLAKSKFADERIFTEHIFANTAPHFSSAIITELDSNPDILAYLTQTSQMLILEKTTPAVHHQLQCLLHYRIIANNQVNLSHGTLPLIPTDTTELQRLKKYKKSAKLRFDRLESAHKQAQQLYSKTFSENQKLQSQLSESQATLQSQQLTIDKTTELNDEISQNSSIERKELANLRAQNQELQTMHTQTLKEHRELQAMHTQTLVQNQNLQSLLAKNKQDLQSQQLTIDNAADFNDNILQESSRKSQEISDLRAQNQELQAMHTQTLKEHQELQAMHTEDVRENQKNLPTTFDTIKHIITSTLKEHQQQLLALYKENQALKAQHFKTQRPSLPLPLPPLPEKLTTKHPHHPHANIHLQQCPIPIPFPPSQYSDQGQPAPHQNPQMHHHISSATPYYSLGFFPQHQNPPWLSPPSIYYLNAYNHPELFSLFNTINALASYFDQSCKHQGITWSGTVALILLRLQLQQIQFLPKKLVSFIKDAIEDIDLTICVPNIADAVNQLKYLPELSVETTLKNRSLTVASITNKEKNISIDLQIRNTPLSYHHPDSFAFIWTPHAQSWLLDLNEIPPHQYQFLTCLQNPQPPLAHNYSLYRALHQVTKHIEFNIDSAIKHTKTLLNQALFSSRVNNTIISNQIMAILHHFSPPSPYWKSAKITLLQLIHLPKRTLPLLFFLFPESAKVPKLLEKKEVHTYLQSKSITPMLEHLKSIWIKTESKSKYRQKLLQSTAPIDWSNISPTPPSKDGSSSKKSLYSIYQEI